MPRCSHRHPGRLTLTMSALHGTDSGTEAMSVTTPHHFHTPHHTMTEVRYRRLDVETLGVGKDVLESPSWWKFCLEKSTGKRVVILKGKSRRLATPHHTTPHHTTPHHTTPHHTTPCTRAMNYESTALSSKHAPRILTRPRADPPALGCILVAGCLWLTKEAVRFAPSPSLHSVCTPDVHLARLRCDLVWARPFPTLMLA
jgi:hypothetical protein